MIPEPSDPVLRMEMARDPQLAGLWVEFCEHLQGQGLDPNRPPPWVLPFRTFANGKIEPYLPAAGLVQYTGWKTAAAGELATRADERQELAGRVTRRWGEALDGLDQLLSVAEEFGMVHVHRLTAWRGRIPKTYPLLIDLHSRGVQVAEETLALLRSGFAAGAEARWRTLHETAVVAAFIAKHGEETVERYAAHDHVRVKKAMEAEQEHHLQLGLEPYTDQEMGEARAAFKELRQRYGSAFMGDYGWAAAALGWKPDGPSPTFVDLEASLDLHLSRAAYRSASQAVHAGPGALLDNPGKVDGAAPMFLTRGTEFGLLEPGVRTAGSIALLSRALMEWRPFPFDRIALQAMRHMMAEVAARFRACDQRVADELATRMRETPE